MSGQHYRCPFPGEPRTTTAARTTSNVGDCPVVPPTLAVTNKVNRLLTLSRVAHEEHDFHDFGNSREQRSESMYASNVSRSLPVVPSQYLSRVPLGHPTLTFKDNCGSGP